MSIQQVLAVYFSPTGTTKKIAEGTAEMLSGMLHVPHVTLDFTLPESRMCPLRFNRDDLVVFGMPVYAGRVPNLLLKFLDTIEGNHCAAIPLVLYGNRGYDDALIELRDILEKKQMHTIAAGAFIGEHSFSKTLAAGRPDASDMALLKSVVRQTVEKTTLLVASKTDFSSLQTEGDFTSLQTEEDFSSIQPVSVKGTPHPYSGYYQPRDARQNPLDIRKVKPLTNEDCDYCMSCIHLCPMGAIHPGNPKDIPGICVKCGACVKGCPRQAKYYTDEGYLFHKQDLEESFSARKEPQWFFSQGL